MRTIEAIKTNKRAMLSFFYHYITNKKKTENKKNREASVSFFNTLLVV